MTKPNYCYTRLHIRYAAQQRIWKVTSCKLACTKLHIGGVVIFVNLQTTSMQTFITDNVHNFKIMQYMSIKNIRLTLESSDSDFCWLVIHFNEVHLNVSKSPNINDYTIGQAIQVPPPDSKQCDVSSPMLMCSVPNYSYYMQCPALDLYTLSQLKFYYLKAPGTGLLGA